MESYVSSRRFWRYTDAVDKEMTNAPEPFTEIVARLRHLLDSCTQCEPVDLLYRAFLLEDPRHTPHIAHLAKLKADAVGVVARTSMVGIWQDAVRLVVDNGGVHVENLHHILDRPRTGARQVFFAATKALAGERWWNILEEATEQLDHR